MKHSEREYGLMEGKGEEGYSQVLVGFCVNIWLGYTQVWV